MDVIVTKKLVIYWPEHTIMNPYDFIGMLREQAWEEFIAAKKTNGVKEVDLDNKIVTRYFIDETATQEWVDFLRELVTRYDLPEPLSYTIEDVTPPTV